MSDKQKMRDKKVKNEAFIERNRDRAIRLLRQADHPFKDVEISGKQCKAAVAYLVHTKLGVTPSVEVTGRFANAYLRFWYARQLSPYQVHTELDPYGKFLARVLGQVCDDVKKNRQITNATNVRGV